ATELTPTDLAKAVENTVIVARNEWKYVAEMVTDFDDQMASVPALPGELNQVLLNLIVNASHAIADSLGATPSSKGVISISTRQVDGQAEIRISDTGSGISQENLQRIFKPFFTTKPAGKGTGQGLAIAREVIVEKHGGRLEVESEVGTGTTFVIRLPFTRAAHSNGEEILV
ncbi:MAG: ATP-binding protein, partial [Planctomycetota bacterium]